MAATNPPRPAGPPTNFGGAVLDELDALTDVCSYVRRARSFLDAPAFCAAHPEEAKQCEETVPAQLRKHVYPTRSYWSAPA